MLPRCLFDFSKIINKNIMVFNKIVILTRQLNNFGAITINYINFYNCILFAFFIPHSLRIQSSNRLGKFFPHILSRLNTFAAVESQPPNNTLFLIFLTSMFLSNWTFLRMKNYHPVGCRQYELALYYELNNSFLNKKAFHGYFQHYSFQHLYEPKKTFDGARFINCFHSSSFLSPKAALFQ